MGEVVHFPQIYKEDDVNIIYVYQCQRCEGEEFIIGIDDQGNKHYLCANEECEEGAGTA